MDLADLAAAYGDEFKVELNEVRRRMGSASTQLRTNIDNANGTMRQLRAEGGKRVGLITPLKELKSMGRLDVALLLKTFTWLAVVQLALHVSYEFGSVLLRPLISLLVGKLLVGAALLLVCPAITYRRLQSNDISDRDARFRLLQFAIVEGIALGHAFKETYLDMPLLFVMPLMIVLYSSLRLRDATSSSRVQLLLASLVAGCAVHWLYAMLMSKLSLLYALVALADAGTAFCTLQYFIAQHSEGQPKQQKCPVQLLLSSVYASVVVRAVFLALLGHYCCSSAFYSQ